MVICHIVNLIAWAGKYGINAILRDSGRPDNLLPRCFCVAGVHPGDGDHLGREESCVNHPPQPGTPPLYLILLGLDGSRVLSELLHGACRGVVACEELRHPRVARVEDEEADRAAALHHLDADDGARVTLVLEVQWWNVATSSRSRRREGKDGETLRLVFRPVDKNIASYVPEVVCDPIKEEGMGSVIGGWTMEV